MIAAAALARDHEHLSEEQLSSLETWGLLAAPEIAALVGHVVALCPSCSATVARWREAFPARFAEAWSLPSLGRLSSTRELARDRVAVLLAQPAEQWLELAGAAADLVDVWAIQELLDQVRARLRGPADDSLLVLAVVDLLLRALERREERSALLEDLHLEARLLEAQALLVLGQPVAALEVAAAAKAGLEVSGSGDALLVVEADATQALLAFACRDPEASLRAWQRAQRRARRLGDAGLEKKLTLAEAFVLAYAGDLATARLRTHAAGDCPLPHWLSVLEAIEKHCLEGTLELGAVN